MPPFDFQALKTLIERDHIGSIEMLVKSLPADLRSHYVLVFSSRSLQQATFRDPRAILYGSDARLMLSFNGDPAERGYQMLETAEYNGVEASFHFREIRFAYSTVGAPSAEISEADPIRCQRCHGMPARPIWDASPLWPGAYGERYRSNLTGPERAGLRQFLTGQPTHPRYRELLAAERFAYRGTFAPEAKDEYAGERREPPNAELSELLDRMNMQVIVRQMRDQRDFSSYQYAVLGAAEGSCGALGEFFPPDQRSRAQAALRRLVEATDAAGARQEESKRVRALSGTPGGRILGATGARSSTLNEVRFLAHSALGIATRDWTLALEKGTDDFTTPRYGNAALAEELRAWIARDDSDIARLETMREYSTDDRYCEYLRKRSRAALAALPAKDALRFENNDGPTGAPPPEPESELQHCAACHVDGAAPALPFDRAASLAALLHHGGYPRGTLLREILFRLSSAAGAAHMPPDVNWSPEQREALSRYVTSLSEPP